MSYKFEKNVGIV